MRKEAMALQKDRTANAIDVHVGSRLRLRRIELGLSQGALANQLGVSFQAVQKYETGDIRISASRLYAAAQALKVPPSFFFDGADEGAQTGEPVEQFDRRDVAALLRGYYGIRNPRLQADVRRLITTLGDAPCEESA
jgi:transcriptional regulator with XRE-family HTH domain